MKRRIPVLTTNPSLGILTYSLPEEQAVAAGQIVSIPLGPRQILGMLWEEDVSSQVKIADNRLRPVSKIYDLPEASHFYRKFIQWVSSYYMAPLGAVLRMGIPFSPATIESREIKNYYVPKREWLKLTPLRQKALEKLSGEKGSVRELAEKAEVSPAVIRALIKTGLITEQKTPLEIALSLPDPDFNAPILSETQKKAAEILKKSIAEKSFETFLLDGVTGSGKTEVYFEAIAQTLRDGKQSLILLPEIALTEPFLKRFQARFGCEPVVWHSDLSQARRRKNWQAIITGQAKVVIGARSALFLPFKAIGLIIVDEAHETSFKQEDGVCYQARDVAVMRAKFENIPVILATATPAIESVMQVRLGNYKEIRLAERHGSAGLPTIHVINMAEQALAKGRWLAPPLVKALTGAIERHEQGLLFLNRRGYAPLTLCRHCGHRIKCPHCTAWMVEHRQLGQMICHHCGFTMPVPDKCPECQTADSLVACGPGVERIAEEAALLFPEARIETITSDTLATPKQAAEFVEKMDQGAIDIIIGTQLITKGYHFPRLTVVGVVD
ncbi:primosomal protein N', partial [Zymomonas sp.]|uniref:replication restart helicase PriA n=1 Tax=Zymomonas sp. TaxID=2068624 RepID=UPI002600A74D